MRIVCPSCNAAYQVPEERVTAGRVVRCARCGAEWSPFAAVLPSSDASLPETSPPELLPPEPEPELEPEPAAPPPPRMVLDDPVPLPEPAPVVPAPSPTPPRRRSLALALAWVASLLLVAAALATLTIRRDDVMRLWPPSTRAYAALGLSKH